MQEKPEKTESRKLRRKNMSKDRKHNEKERRQSRTTRQQMIKN